MIIDIDRLPEGGLKVCKDFEFFRVDLVEEDAVFLRPVYAEISVKKIGDELFLKGRISACLSCICSRCLTPFEFSIDSKFDLVYIPEELGVVKEQLKQDEMSKLFYYNRKLDLKEVVLGQLNLAFPVKPLCSEDCQGICPVCGNIIDTGVCSCITDESDPRLEKLKSLLKDKN